MHNEVDIVLEKIDVNKYRGGWIIPLLEKFSGFKFTTREGYSGFLKLILYSGIYSITDYLSEKGVPIGTLAYEINKMVKGIANTTLDEMLAQAISKYFPGLEKLNFAFFRIWKNKKREKILKEIFEKYGMEIPEDLKDIDLNKAMILLSLAAHYEIIIRKNKDVIYESICRVFLNNFGGRGLSLYNFLKDILKDTSIIYRDVSKRENMILFPKGHIIKRIRGKTFYLFKGNEYQISEIECCKDTLKRIFEDTGIVEKILKLFDVPKIKSPLLIPYPGLSAPQV